MKRKIYLILAAVCVLNIQAFAGLGSGKEGTENGKSADRMSAPATEQHEIQAEVSVSTETAPVAEEVASAPVTEAPAEVRSKKEMRRDLRTALKDYRKARKTAKPQDGTQLLAVIFAILIPPVGVLIWEAGLTVHFWIDLLLTILFYLPGMIYALYIVLAT